MGNASTKIQGCPQCEGERAFAMPQHLLEKFKAGDVILFVGSGISTEDKRHCRSTFYDDIRAELKISDTPSFPELMARYCLQPDGRIKLIQKIKDRFDYFVAFDDFYWFMTRFHRAVSPLFMIKDIITTNWDDFFERVCGIDAFVYDSDLAFWDATPRRLMKIHGSITNFGSIVATTNDYQRSFKRLNNGPLGAHLKSLIARKTVVYSGYSLSDPNYLRLIRNLARMMGTNIRQSYFVSPNINVGLLKTAPIPLVPIETDGSHFLEHVRLELSEHCGIIRDEAFDVCDSFLDKVIEVHSETADKYLKTQHPLLFFALGYQDGLIHALKRIRTRRNTGEYYSKARILRLIHMYEFKLEQFVKEKDFWNAAYALGYQCGIILLLGADENIECATPPLIDYPFAAGAHSLSTINRYSVKKIPKHALAQVKKMQKSHPGLGRQLVPDHTPYL